MALDGLTPAEVAGIKVEGKNKWIALIQNAKRNQQTSFDSSNNLLYSVKEDS